MKKIISSKFAMILFFWCVLFFALAFIALGFELFDLIEEKGAGYLSFAVFLLLSCFFLWYLNRAACIIWVEDGIVKRKGLICGFYKECRIDAIQAVSVRYVWRSGDFLFLIDTSTHKFNHMRKDSYICFFKTRKNLDFLRTFWKGEIKEEIPFV